MSSGQVAALRVLLLLLIMAIGNPFKEPHVRNRRPTSLPISRLLFFFLLFGGLGLPRTAPELKTGAYDT